MPKEKKLKAHKINREKGRETGRQRKQKRDNSSQVPFLGIGETWSHMSIPHYKFSPVQQVTMKMIMMIMIFCRCCGLPQVQ